MGYEDAHVVRDTMRVNPCPGALVAQGAYHMHAPCRTVGLEAQNTGMERAAQEGEA